MTGPGPGPGPAPGVRRTHDTMDHSTDQLLDLITRRIGMRWLAIVEQTLNVRGAFLKHGHGCHAESAGSHSEPAIPETESNGEKETTEDNGNRK